jgi:hypothetical protein
MDMAAQYDLPDSSLFSDYQPKTEQIGEATTASRIYGQLIFGISANGFWGGDAG